MAINFRLKRIFSDELITQGELTSEDGLFECKTLERLDPSVHKQMKPRMALPAGQYKMKIETNVECMTLELRICARGYYAKAKIGGLEPWKMFAGSICIGTECEDGTLSGQGDALDSLSDYIDEKLAAMLPKERFRATVYLTIENVDNRPNRE